MFNALAPPRTGSNPPTANMHRLLPGLPGYLIPFAPLAFVASVSGVVQSLAFATGVPPDIYAFHCYTGNSRLPSDPLAKQSSVPFPGWARGFHTKLASPPTHALRPVNPNNAWDLCITAAAGTELAVPSFPASIKLVTYSETRFARKRQRFTIRRPSSLTRRRTIRLSPIVNDSRLLPPVGVWTVSQFQCG